MNKFLTVAPLLISSLLTLGSCSSGNKTSLQASDTIEGGQIKFDILRPVPSSLSTVHSRKFGMRSEAEDNTEAFRKALDYCHEHPGTRLVIDKGVYRFTESDKIRFKDIQTCLIDGREAEFIFAKTGVFMTIERCNCLEINGLAIDVDRVANPVDDVFRVANANPEERTIDFVFFQKEDVDEDMIIQAITQCDPETLTFGAKSSSKEHYIYMDPSILEKVEKTAPNVLSITHNGALGRYADGDTFIMRHHVYDGCVFNICGETANLTFDGVKIYGSYGSGYGVGDLANHYQIINSVIGIDPGDKTGAHVSLGADGIHIAGSGGYFYLASCDISAQGDDALNVHDGIGYVYEVDGNKIKMYSTQTRLNEGEALAFKDTHFNELGFSATIISFGNADDSRTGKVITFNKNVSTAIQPGCIAYSTVTDSGNYIIRDNYFHENRARALLLQSDNGLCENNVFYKVQGQAIKIVIDIVTHLWQEGTGVKHLTVSNNVFDSCDYSGWGEQITIDTNINYHHADCAVFKDINITDNEFKNFPKLVLNAMNVDGLKFTGNKIDKPDCILLQSYCENTDIEGNVFDTGI